MEGRIEPVQCQLKQRTSNWTDKHIKNTRRYHKMKAKLFPIARLIRGSKVSRVKKNLSIQLIWASPHNPDTILHFSFSVKSSLGHYLLTLRQWHCHKLSSAYVPWVWEYECGVEGRERCLWWLWGTRRFLAPLFTRSRELGRVRVQWVRGDSETHN